MQFDVIVIGGSYAGLSAALQIARARRPVLVIDAGLRRNRFAHSSHGFLGHDGRAPADIVEDARKQLLAYPDARWLQGNAVRADSQEDGFTIETEDGAVHHARRLVLATGVVDELPGIPGLQERWGRSVFHCPYCHGFELEKGRLGVLATGPASMHQAMLIPDWGETVLFTNDAFHPDEDELQKLAARGVAIERSPVSAVSGERADIHLADGRTVRLDGLFTAPHTRPATSLAEQLGCAIEEGPVGSYIRTDGMKETTIMGVFACGDAARPAGSVALAVGAGAIAGAAAHQSLIFRK